MEYIKVFHEKSSENEIKKSIEIANRFNVVTLISYLDSERITYLGNELGELKNPKKLELDLIPFKNIGSQGMISISNGIKNLDSLTQLFIYIQQGNIIKSKGLAHFSLCIQNFQQLTHLTIRIYSGNSIDKKGCSALGDTIQRLQNLIYLDLKFSNNYIEQEGAQKIGEAIKSLNNLISLSLVIMDYSVNQIGASELTNCFSHLNNLVQLNFEIGYSFDNSKTDQKINFSQCFQQIDKLEKLVLILQCRNYSQNQGEFFFGRAISSLKSLRSLVINVKLFEKLNQNDQQQLLNINKKFLQNLNYIQIKLHHNENLEAKLKMISQKFARLVVFEISNNYILAI